ncbi:MAG: hypothetical protein IT223_05855, partial [Crocinitomicaceae bacterium]|nr:hypothetical protein [Crocinitomicaceae bacterium]
PVNLLMASGIFFAIAPGIAKYSNVILRSAIVLLLLFAIILVNLEVPMQWEFMSPLQSLGDFKKMISFFLFNGYYSVLPWIIFFLAGLVHGRGNIRPNGFFPPSSLLGLGLVAMSFIVQQFFLGLYDNIDPIPTYGSIAFRLKLYFPAFVFFATGVCIMLLNLLTFFFSRYELPRYQKTIQNISSSKYSVYFFMMLFCFIISSGFNTVLLSQESMLILFTLGLTLLSVWVTLLWKKRLNPKAPVEWLVKYVSGSTKN